MVGARARDDGVPDDGLVGLVRAVGDARRGRGPLGRDVDEELLGVPGEQRREVGVERELDDGILFLFGTVVVRPALYSVRRTAVSELSATMYHSNVMDGC